MKSRWLITALLLALLALLVAWIARNTYWDEISMPGPLRGEAVTNPFYAAQKLAESLGAASERRGTLGDLPEAGILVLTDWHWALIEDRRKQIEAWVEAGGRLVLDASLLDGEELLRSWTGLAFEPRKSPKDDEEDADTVQDGDSDEVIDPAELGISGPFSGRCTQLAPLDARGQRMAGDEIFVCTLDVRGHLVSDRPLAWGLGDDHVQAARVRVGKGSVTWVNATPFGNRELTIADHGQLFVGATQLHRGDVIVFASEREQPSLLALIWMHGAPVVVLGLLMLAALLWRGGMRFGPLAAPTDLSRRSLAEQIRGTGQFTLRLGDSHALHRATARALHEAARSRLPGYESLPHGERIAAIAAASGLDATALASAVDPTGPRRRGDLANTIATLESARRRLLERARRPGFI